MGPSEPQDTTPPVEPEQQPINTEETAPELTPAVEEPVVTPTPETPEVPEMTEAPEVPETPEVQQEPEAPEVPAAPVAPVVPVETAPGASPEPSAAFPNQTAPAPELPVKKSKKGLIIGLIIAGVVGLGLAAAGIVYATVYNSPENVVIDAFSKALAAKSGSINGSGTFKTQDSAVKLELRVDANESKQVFADTTVTITSGGKDYKLQGHFAGTEDEVYVKLDDLRKVVTSVFGEEYSSMIEAYYGTLLDKIDGKWVVIKQSDLDELSSGSVTNKETKCVQDEFAKLQNDASLRNELVDIYKKNPLFIIESKGSDSNGNRYSLTPVAKDKAQNFKNDLVETKFFKALDDCTSTDLKKEFTDSTSDGSTADKATGSLEIWVDGWTHELNKVSLNIKDDEAELTSEFMTKFNNNPAVTIPKADTTVDDLKTEINRLQQQFTSGASSSTYSLGGGYDYSY